MARPDAHRDHSQSLIVMNSPKNPLLTVVECAGAAQCHQGGAINRAGARVTVEAIDVGEMEMYNCSVNVHTGQATMKNCKQPARWTGNTGTSSDLLTQSCSQAKCAMARHS